MTDKVTDIRDHMDKVVMEDPPADPPPPEKPDRVFLPENCPVIPLGAQGDVRYYIDALGQMRDLQVRKHARLDIMGLFGEYIDYLPENWPAYDKDGKTTGKWNSGKVEEALLNASAAKGLIDIFGTVRETGGWVDDEGHLVMHCGKSIYREREKLPPGPLGPHIYPSMPPGPTPLDDDPGPQAAAELMELFGAWYWKRGLLDASLLLGWVGCALLGAALDWRAVVWLTGGSAAGKSTLLKVLGAVIGSLTEVGNATAAGIWQQTRMGSNPVIYDEGEPNPDSKKMQAVIELARLACDGKIVLRGGADHTGSQFMAQMMFLFSSILLPPLTPQDQNRMAILELDKVAAGAKVPDFDTRQLGILGRGFRRRLLNRWGDVKARIEAYHKGLTAAGFGGRTADVFSALLGVAHALERDAPDPKFVKKTVAQMAGYLTLAVADQEADERNCLQHLLTQVVPDQKAGDTKLTVAELIQQSVDSPPCLSAPKVLERFGLKVKLYEQVHMLFVANTHSGLARLFDGSHWGTIAGSTAPWAQSLGRLDGAVKHPSGQYFAGAKARCTMVPLNVLEGIKVKQRALL
ncbi:MAG: hypothetical protein V3W41_22500 [Planctomycetota bacterium]